MFEISGNNFNDWFLQLKMVLRVERKLFVIEQPISLASPTDSEYLRSGMRSSNPCLRNKLEWSGLWGTHFRYKLSMLANRMRENQLAHMSLDEELCGTANKKSLNAKGKNKVKGKGNDKKVYIPQPKTPKPTAMERPTKDDACHHCKEVGHCKRNRPAYLAELIKKKKQVGTASSSDLTPPYTPQHNRVSERRNRTLLDMVRSMMNLTTLPLSFWDYALESATRILNMVPTKKVDKTPYELWYGKVPNLSYLKVWGCEALVKRDTPDKLEQRSVKCIFIGYPKETMGYYFYFPPENKIIVARNAEFFKKHLISQEICGRAVDLEEIQEEEDTAPSEITSNIPQEVEDFELPQPPQEEVIPIRRSERTHRAPNRLCLNVEVEEHSLGDLNEPTSYEAAMLDSESDKWIDAMNTEIQSMMDNMVWVLVNRPPGCKTVRSKWIFKKKTDMDGIVHTYKACLVAKGYT
ncbi:retrotransposon protein, putative, ty1-copia subclass [Tanacetum coccineum]|uniref:Retrotransposon protein, putative, ty1-copia subclass n=1 Tax=Tanacetum coccineum TaxID=301880 RepID=A0ABQ5F661_9ASTR